jgi:hypothetical protein
VTPGRLAVWWAALARDLVLVLIRNEKPAHTPALGNEGRVLAELYAAARKQASFGIPRALLEGKPTFTPGLKLLGLRVPPGVGEPAGPATAAGSGASGTDRPFRIEGEWRGRETVPEGTRYISMTFKNGSGTLFYEGGFSVGFPLLTLSQPQKGTVRFSVAVRGGVRYYQGRYDGQKLTGTIHAEERGPSIGSFELGQR